MKTRLLSTIFLALVLPIVCLAAETKFFTAAGNYVLSPELSLVISKDNADPCYKYKLVSSSSGVGAPMKASRATDPFLVYWDAGAKTLWWATPQFIGYLDVHDPDTSNSESQPRVSRAHGQFPKPPTVFTTELERTVPVRP